MVIKKFKGLFIFLALILLFVIISIGFNIFNEHTSINLKTEEIKDIYTEYDNLVNDSLNIINNISYKEGYTCILNETYKNNDNYNYYNEMLMHICNIINSNGTLIIDKKLDSVKYEKLEPVFKNKFIGLKERATALYNENEQTIINDYLNSFINLISVNNESSYQESLNNSIINIFGKKYLYNDYKKEITYEKEIINIIDAILQDIQKNLTN